MDDNELPLWWFEVLERLGDTLTHLPCESRDIAGVALQELQVRLVILARLPVVVLLRLSQVAQCIYRRVPSGRLRDRSDLVRETREVRRCVGEYPRSFGVPLGLRADQRKLIL